VTLGLAAVFLFSLARTSRSVPAALAFTHVTLIDTAGGLARPDQTVVISGGKILAVGASGAVRPPKGARIIDSSGKFLIPGLWDMHVHIAGINADPAWSKNVILPELVASGITGVRDMGGDLEVLEAWRREILNGTLTGPHIVAGGPMLVPRGPKSAEQYPVANADQARAAVKELKLRGADFIKVIGMPSRDAFFAVADEAGKQGLPFVGHVPAVVTAAEASDRGMRSIEHIVYSGLALDCSSREEELRKTILDARAKGDANQSTEALSDAVDSFSAEKADRLWARFKKNGTWVVPTLYSISQQVTPEQQAQDPGLDFVPAALREEWDPRAAKNQASREERAWWTKQFANDLKLAAAMHKAGVSMLAGSDSLDRFVFPGSSLHRELEMLGEAGFTPLEALQSATRDAARFLGREEEFGSVRVGAQADVVLLEANPIDNIANAGKINAVVLEGVLFDRASLDALLTEAKAAAKAVRAK
jgi:imidazolonepropionase-like amidohydrolase